MDSGTATYSFYEFFAGGGMARAGLGAGWDCLFANDFDPKKAEAYARNWGGDHLRVGDVGALKAKDLPGQADLAWASFPCQDLSLAGNGAGLAGGRSGTFWPFWKLMTGLVGQGRGPKVVLLENVYGALTSKGGKDFAALARAMSLGGYRFGALVIDAVHFVPQSRPRLFVVGVRKDIPVPRTLTSPEGETLWTPKALREAHAGLEAKIKADWIWWRTSHPLPRTKAFSDVIEENPQGVIWHSPEQTQKILSMMTSINLRKVKAAQEKGGRQVGGVYRRTRNGVQRAEVRFDGVSGCLRTPAGGSSRQSILVVEGDKICSRLLSPREAARLMGLPDDYWLPENYNQAYHLCGDGVVTPVVRYLAECLIEPLLDSVGRSLRHAAE